MGEFELISLVVIGLLAGFVGGLLGIGGSIVMIPAMTEVLGPSQHLYQAAAMIVNFFVVVPAVVQHRRARAIDVWTVSRLVPLAVMAVIVGVALSESRLFAGDREPFLRVAFGLFLLCLAGFDLYRAIRPSVTRPNEVSAGELTWVRASLVAVPTGLIAGLLGVGGGVLAVPLQRRFLGVPTRNAIANSAAVIIATSLVGASYKNYALARTGEFGWQPLWLALPLIPTAIVGSLLGSHLTHRLPVRGIKIAFFVLLLIVAARLTVSSARSIATKSTTRVSSTGFDRAGRRATGSTFRSLFTDGSNDAKVTIEPGVRSTTGGSSHEQERQGLVNSGPDDGRGVSRLAYNWMPSVCWTRVSRGGRPGHRKRCDADRQRRAGGSVRRGGTGAGVTHGA